MKPIVLKWLNEDEIKILKQIVIISDRKNGEVEIGSVLYTRQITKTYNYIKEENEETTNSIDRLFGGYLKQKNYPHDQIDEMILQGVKHSFPKSIVRNDSILFNIDLDKINILKKRIIIPSTITLAPHFSIISNSNYYRAKTIKGVIIKINIFCRYKPEFLDDHIFYATYPISNEDILDNLTKIKFE